MVPTTEPKPSLTTYKDLQDKYSKTLKCPCSNVIIPHQQFVSLSPVFHQVCKSDFVTEKWLSLLKRIRIRYSNIDWRNRAFSQFHLLSDLCELANKTIDDARHRFLSQPFIISNVLPETDFHEQLNLTIDQFFQSTIDYFGLLIKTVQILIQVDQPYSGQIGAHNMRREAENPIAIFRQNATDVWKVAQVKFKLTGPRNAEPISTTCICATDTHCNASTGIYDIDKDNGDFLIYVSSYNVSGLIAGCSVTDSLLHSTLECYYSNSNCLSILMKKSKEIHDLNPDKIPWFDVRPLDYNITFSRFQPNTSISEIVQKIMIEQWNSLISYDQFYESCAPTYCIYSQRIYKKNIFETMIINIDRMKAKRLGQWATRLYVVLFALGLVILALHTIIRPQEFTKDFDGSSLNLYTKLFKRYGNKLKCPCSSIASPYKRFMNIEARFHEICSSPFASEEGRLNLTADLVANLSIYDERDYRRFLSAHLQFLEGLCQLSDQTVNIFTRQFLSSLFVTNELLSEMNFRKRLDLIIEQSKLNVPTTLTHLLYLIRMINNGNAFISTYGTNFKYIHPWKTIYNTYMPTQAIVYDDKCSCGLYSNCTTQATFITTNPSKIIPIKGLKIGCTPSESFRISTLECLYNESSEFGCSLQFQQVSSAIGTFGYRRSLPVIGDFNGDSRLDIAFQDFNTSAINVFLGYGNGLFTPEIVSVHSRLDNINKMVAGDFDNDNRLDLAAQSTWFGKIFILPAYGDGAFQQKNYIQICNSKSFDFALTHIDTDGCLDIVAVCSAESTVMVYFGNGEGAFYRIPTMYYRHEGSHPLRVAIADFNRDSYQDIAVLNHYGQNIGIFLGDGTRNFKTHKMSSTHKEKFPFYFAIGDFNNDTLPDVAVSYNCSNFIDVFFGNVDGSLGNSTIFQIGDEPVVDQIIVSDFNADGNLDIGFGKTGQAISLLIGNGYGDFTLQTVFPIRFSGASAWTGVGDFNGDDLVDIINVDLNSTSQDVFLNVCK
ncbi:unnamed protein product [Adineta steineri]|uniref:Uncharacterized protein n=1 Tax=Adineta steineri TaxID=433720 RepID=A0A814ECC9_9BILA|nr:unnamed protein product [Adineta steineri]